MKNKGIIHGLKTKVTAKAKSLAKDFKKKHKLSGKTLNVARIFEGGVVHRAKLLAASSGCLLVLLFFCVLMCAFQEEHSKVCGVFQEALVIGGVFALLSMHFLAKIMVWVMFKALAALFSPLLAFIYPLDNLWTTIGTLSEVVMSILIFLSGLF